MILSLFLSLFIYIGLFLVSLSCLIHLNALPLTPLHISFSLQSYLFLLLWDIESRQRNFLFMAFWSAFKRKNYQVDRLLMSFMWKAKTSLSHSTSASAVPLSSQLGGFSGRQVASIQFSGGCCPGGIKGQRHWRVFAPFCPARDLQLCLPLRKPPSVSHSFSQRKSVALHIQSVV